MLGRLLRSTEARDTTGSLSWPDYLQLANAFSFGGISYVMPPGGFQSMTAQRAARNPIVFRCMDIRGSVFSQIEFAFRDQRNRTLFRGAGLTLLEDPWPGGSTDQLLRRMCFDGDRYGNSYWYIQPPIKGRPQGTLVWLDPTMMNIVTGDVAGPSGNAPVGKFLLGYQTTDRSGKPQETFKPEEIVHYRPIPDPEHPFRGISWLSSLLPDIVSDSDLTDWKHSFVQNSATPNLVVTFPAGPDGRSLIGKEAFTKFQEKMEATHTGPQAGFKTLYLTGGADVKTVGANFEQMMLNETQSHGELRICSAAGVPPNLVGVSEGLKGSTLNTANFAASRRSFTDITVRPDWMSACTALAPAANPPGGSRLWYDASEVPFIQADMQDAANQRQADASTMASLVNAGYDPDSIVESIEAGNWSGLKHTGLASVQLQPIGVPTIAADEANTGGQIQTEAQ